MFYHNDYVSKILVSIRIEWTRYYLQNVYVFVIYFLFSPQIYFLFNSLKKHVLKVLYFLCVFPKINNKRIQFNTVDKTPAVALNSNYLLFFYLKKNIYKELFNYFYIFYLNDTLDCNRIFNSYNFLIYTSIFESYRQC